MQNPIQVFENKAFGKIRTVDTDGQVWFVGKDIAEVLGYERPTKAVQDHVDDEDKDVVPIRDSIGRMQNTPVINESGLYSLILSSKPVCYSCSICTAMLFLHGSGIAPGQHGYFFPIK